MARDLKRFLRTILAAILVLSLATPLFAPAASAAVKIRAVRLNAKRVKIDLSQTPTYQLRVKLTPSKASVSSLAWASSDKSVATVDANGLVSFHAAGSVRIRAKSPSGKKASCLFLVTASGESVVTATGKKRALVIGEGRKSTVSGTYRLEELAMVPDEVAGIKKLFTSHDIKTSSIVNSTRAKVIAAIKTAFADAKDNDINYLYMICHGGVSSTGTYLMFPCNNGFITASQLRNILDDIPGHFVVMLGCCQSGSVIAKGAKGAADNAADGFAQAFLAQDENLDSGATSKAGELLTGKYSVLCACTGKQNGYGIVSYSGKTGRYLYGYNLFGYALGLAAGWDLLNGKAVPAAAKADGNGGITMQALYESVRDKVSRLYDQYADEGVFSRDESQTVTMYAPNGDLIVF